MEAFDVIDGHIYKHAVKAVLPLLSLLVQTFTFMSHQPVTIVGNGNIAGNNLNNVGNRTQNIFNGRQKGKGMLLLNVPAQWLVLIINGQRSRCSSQKQPWMRF